MTVDCLDPDSVLDWLDGTLTAARVAEIEAHIDGCDACRRLISEGAAGDGERASASGTPARLGPYEIRGVVGRGGMGEVLRAFDPRLDREVAVKIVRPPGQTWVSGKMMARFEREARAAAAINHPNVLAVHDVGRDQGVPYIVTELLDGETLRARVRRGAIPMRTAVGWAREIARGLAAAHDRGVIHRDLKPENVFLTSDERVKILDFGLATLRHDPLDDDDRVIAGTLGYMAPEQILGDPIDHRADLFALGAVLHEMLTGKQAFTSSTAPPDTAAGDAELAESVLRQDPVERDAALLAGAPPALIQLLRRCLDKAPAARFQSARDLAFALDLIALPPAATPTPADRAPRRRSRWPYVVAVPAIAAVALLVARVRRDERVPTSGTARPVQLRKVTHQSSEILAARFSPQGHIVVTLVAVDGAKRTPRTVMLTPGVVVLAPLKWLDGAIVTATSALKNFAAIADWREVRGTPVGRFVGLESLGSGDRYDAIYLNVASTDFLPGEKSAVIRVDDQLRRRVEAPIGTPVYHAHSLDHLRVSPDGALAFVEGPDDPVSGALSRVVRIDRGAGPRPVGGMWHRITGLAWTPDGDELIASAARAGEEPALWRIPSRGDAVRLWPGAFVLQDIAADGSILVSSGAAHRRIFVRRPHASGELELSQTDNTRLLDLDEDATAMLLAEEPTPRKPRSELRLASTDGSGARRVAFAATGVLSRDGTAIVTTDEDQPWQLTVLGIAAGTPPRSVPVGPNFKYLAWGWLHDHRELAYIDAGRRLILHALDAAPVVLGAFPAVEDVFLPSPDGRYIAAVNGAGQAVVVALPGLGVTVLSERRDRVPCGWSKDGTAVVLAERAFPLAITRVELATLAETTVATISRDDAALTPAPKVICPHDDGTAYAYAYTTRAEDLQVIEGLLATKVAPRLPGPGSGSD